MIRRHTQFLSVLLLVTMSCWADSPRWTEQKARDWYAAEPWLVGSNYIPTYAVNELEMWQADTFDPTRIDLELGWAEKLGMNTMRVFLHDLLWEQDAAGFTKRMNTFLEICQKHTIRPMFVLFDSCWDPAPALGKQRAPRPGIHNSGWVQSPGAKALADPTQVARLKSYVTGVVGAFSTDKRVLAWDIWNEPDNRNNSSYGLQELSNKVALVDQLLPQAFAWARSANPEQPLTSGVWQGKWNKPSKLSPTSKIQLESSDITTFHSYGPPNQFSKRIEELKRYGRPMICTEYMARGVRSTFAGTLPIAKKDKVGAINWGFVLGKTQTNLPWDSWQHPYIFKAPTIWFHDIFYPDGKPYRPEEIRVIQEETGASPAN